jgi:hypothetical protein
MRSAPRGPVIRPKAAWRDPAPPRALTNAVPGSLLMGY